MKVIKETREQETDDNPDLIIALLAGAKRICCGGCGCTIEPT